MLHLSSERLAELADGEPNLAEAEHLAACANCATERSAHQRLLTLASDERDRLAPPLTNWASLSARLREEQIIATRRPGWLIGLRVAAGIVFALGFGALGRMSANAPVVPSSSEMRQLAHELVREKATEVLPAAFGRQPSAFENVEDALAALESAQRQYDQAVAFIAAHDPTAQTPEAGDVFRTRLAALDEMAETSRQALATAPTDPVLNQYYISTLGAREGSLQFK